jgi:hypothetical protein
MPEQSGDIFDDDPSIPANTKILRRIPAFHYHAPEDRPASPAFNNSPDGSGTSVDIMASDEQCAKTLQGHEDFGLVSLTVGQIRSVGLGIKRAPVDGNPQHAILLGPKKRVGRKLAMMAVWVKRPE